MSVSFAPIELKEEIKELLEILHTHKIQNSFDEENLIDEDVNDDFEEIIDEETEIYLHFPHDDYELNETLTIRETLEIVEEAKKCRKHDDYKFIGDKSALFHIDSGELINFEIPSITEVIDEQKYTMEIVEGFTSYGMKLILDGNYNDIFPPFEDFEMFISITSESNIDESVLENLVEGYKFELKSTLGVTVQPTPRLSFHSEEELTDFEDPPSRLRPLLKGKGVIELLKLYNSSLSTTNAEILILTYTKVIEYVSQTVIQKDLVNSATKKLFSPKALEPDANYILELSKIFEGNRNNQKDFNAIKLTVESCCDLLEIAEIAPPFLNETRRLNQDSNDGGINTAYKEIANAISQTRNMLAHAKTNYEKKGKECPEDQLDDFANCLDVLAQQIIRWFARENEDNRVV